MTKSEFLLQLRRRLSGLPQQEVEERLIFYREMIEDRMEEGLSEHDAVAAVGSVDVIAAQILADTPMSRTTAEQSKPKKRTSPWVIVLLVLGSPIWLSLLLSVGAVLFSVYVTLWAVILSLWVVFATLVACAFCGLASTILLLLRGNLLVALAMLSFGLVLSGLSILAFFLCKAVSSSLVLLAKQSVRWLKSCFTRKESVQ